MTKTPEERQPSSVGKLAVLMVTAFMDMVGILMIVPLMPFYAKSMGAGGFVVGLLVASFSIAQLLMAPVWGRLSESRSVSVNNSRKWLDASARRASSRA